jgi:Zn-dependent protease
MRRRASVHALPRSGALRLAGVLVRADLSCVLGAALAAWTFASGLLPELEPGRGTVAYWTAGGVGALLVVGSLAVHEMGHAIAARHAGLSVARITFSFIGGTSEVVGTIRRGRDEFLIAAAGPCASLAAALAAALGHVVLVETAGPGLAATIAALLAVANLAIALLNGLPGLPLDGGHMLRGAVWAASGRPDAGTFIVAWLGRRLGDTMILVAVFGSAFGFVGIALWAALLGLMLRER